MRIHRNFFNLVMIVIFFTFFLLGITQINILDENLNKESNYIHSSSVSTDLSFFTWGGEGAERSGGIALDSLNNSYIVGSTTSFGNGGADFCLIKFNSSGVVWNRTYGGIDADYGRAIVLDSNDNIYIAGYTSSFGAGNRDIWLLKLNKTGDIVWSHTWGGIENDYVWGIALDSYSDVYVVGETYSFGEGSSDLCVVKFNSSGVAWYYTCGGIDSESGYGLTVDSQENLYAVGSTKSFGNGGYDVFLVKFNSTGMLWNKTWGCAFWDRGTAVEIGPSGNLYVAGYFELPSDCLNPYPSSGYTDADIGIVKFNSEGVYQWNSTWHGGDTDYCFDMVIDPLENIYVPGYIMYDDYGDDYDVCLVRFNSSGVPDWSCKWGGSGMENSEGAVLGPNGSILVCGATDSHGVGNIYLVKFNPGQCPVPTPQPNGTIPGYSVILLIFVVSIVSIYIIKKKNVNL